MRFIPMNESMWNQKLETMLQKDAVKGIDKWDKAVRINLNLVQKLLKIIKLADENNHNQESMFEDIVVEGTPEEIRDSEKMVDKFQVAKQRRCMTQCRLQGKLRTEKMKVEFAKRTKNNLVYPIEAAGYHDNEKKSYSKMIRYTQP